jgi:hypothetical protein
MQKKTPVSQSGWTDERCEREEGVLTSKDLVEVLVDFEPVRHHTKCEKEDGEAKKEKRREHTRREPYLAGKRRDEIVLRKATYRNSGG